MAIARRYENCPSTSYNFSFTVCVREFSNECLHRPGQAAESLAPHENFTVTAFANGIDSVNEGYISMLLESKKPEHYCSQCIVEVIDAAGEKRFSRSFSFPVESRENRRCLIDRYIKRETLLEEPRELLPGDGLTVGVHVDVIHFWVRHNEVVESFTTVQIVNKAFTARVRGQARDCLSLDSKVFEKLREASSYFQSMFELPMEEQRTRLMKIPNDERSAFKKACCLLMGSNCIVLSIKDICHVYIVAKKYLLEVVVDNCRRLLVALLRCEEEEVVEARRVGLPRLCRLAEAFDDEILEKILESLMSGNDALSGTVPKVESLNSGNDALSETVPKVESLNSGNDAFSGTIPKVESLISSDDALSETVPKVESLNSGNDALSGTVPKVESLISGNDALSEAEKSNSGNCQIDNEIEDNIENYLNTEWEVELSRGAHLFKFSKNQTDVYTFYQ